MKKRGIAILALAIVLTLGTATISVLGAEGWSQSNGSWVYYNSSGSQVTNEWKKGADNLWRYLNSSGQMATSAWVDSTYYVDSNGILVTDKWMKLENPHWNRGDEEDQYQWFYFGSSGKVITDAWKKIDDKWYYFDSDGVMQTGWVDDDMYYCDASGAMKTGWQKLAPPEGKEDSHNEDQPTVDGVSYDGTDWYYFGSNGKKFVPDDQGSAEFGERKIDGTYYCFDSDGAMQIGWRNIESSDDSDASIADYKYFGGDGKVKTGWLSLEPPEKISNQYDHSVEWFYFSKQGVPEYGPKEGEASTSDFVKIKGSTYLFNDRGNPVYGLQKVRINSSESTAYYFGEWSQSIMMKGKKQIAEGDGSTTEFYFMDNGRGVTGVRDSRLYYMGKLQEAESGTKYQAITIPDGNSSTTYVVNTSGKVSKSATVKTADGVKYKTNSSGVLIQVDEENVPGNETFREPYEPAWDY